MGNRLIHSEGANSQLPIIGPSVSELVWPTHAITLPLLDSGFGVIFVEAGNNKTSVARKPFKMWNRRIKNPVEVVQSGGENVVWLLDDFAGTHRQLNLWSENQQY